jgi:radical SAM superfamily enzyme YgiQ (UPF0313 family)
VLISTYELGRQPFGVASAAAWLERAGASVRCLDLAVEQFDEGAVAAADLVAFYVPMHTATRLAVAAVARVTSLNPDVHLCFFGLYAPMNEAFLRRLGAKTVLGGEFEEGLAALAERLAAEPGGYTQGPQREPLVSLGRRPFLVPDRAGLPPLGRYASVTLPNGERRTAGYTEASRGCKHTCRHCPIVPVYGGRFRVVPRDVVLEDIRRQVAAGAQHITFGDPDFFNGIGHALPLVQALHREFPDLSYDVTIKIEHLLRHAEHIATLRETGCLFVTSAAEAIDDAVLAIFAKRHTREQFIEVVSLFRTSGLALCPTFVAFTPWTSLTGYRDLLALVAELGLIDNVPPIQLAVRLLIPAGSRLLDLPEVRALVGAFDDAGLSYRWTHPDPRVDELCAGVTAAVQGGLRTDASRRETFQHIWALTHAALGLETPALPPCPEGPGVLASRVSEPWFC